jgi:hypothetical protein
MFITEVSVCWWMVHIRQYGSSQKFPFVGGWCMFVSTYTSLLSFQTIAVKSFLVLDRISPRFSRLFCGSKSCGIPLL